MSRKLNIEVPGDEPMSAPVDTAQVIPSIVQLEPEVVLNPVQAGLPDAKNIDPSKIRHSVLTQQGWVIPDQAQVQANG